MTAITESEQTVARASAPMSIGAVAVALLGTALGIVAAAFHLNFAVLLFGWTALAGLSGIVAARYEHGEKNASVCLALALAVLIGNLIVLRFVYGVRPGNFVVFSPIIPIAVIAPFLAQLLLSKKMSAVQYLTILWVASVALIATVAILSQAFSLQDCIALCVAAPFGPWATQVARVVSLPNAGEGFSLPLALAFSIGLGAVAYIIVSRPQKAAYWLMPFTWLLIGWLAIGLATLISCME